MALKQSRRQQPFAHVQPRPRRPVTLLVAAVALLAWAPRQLAPPPDPVQAVKNHIDAYNKRDLDAVVASYAADAQLFIFPAAEPLYTGHDQIRAAYGDQLEGNCLGTMMRECPDLNIDLVSWQVLGRYVVTYQLVTLVRTEPPLRYVLIYEVRGGLFRNAWFLVDN